MTAPTRRATERVTDAVVTLSLGAGVQSTAMLLMACAGEIEPRPIEAIFADTGWEPQHVYDHLDWLESVSTIPISRVAYGNIREHALNKPLGVDMPLYLLGAESGPGILRRQCTQRYKIVPIRRRVRELMKEHGAKSNISMMGISLGYLVLIACFGWSVTDSHARRSRHVLAVHTTITAAGAT
jgi:3'-phosphoadenosine 5'-phosphosulfate sulfotransferase (PAPS reductase)/FAD synthetase